MVMFKFLSGTVLFNLCADKEQLLNFKDDNKSALQIISRAQLQPRIQACYYYIRNDIIIIILLKL